MKTPKTTISQVIAELEQIRAQHGDLPCYTFDEYDRSPDRDVNICAVIQPSKYESWQFPHVQIS